MTRVKRGVAAHKRRKNIISQAKGFKWGRKSKYRLAKDALKHASMMAFNDRHKKKTKFRELWQVKINAAVRAQGMTYSRFIDALTKAKIKVNRKMLAIFAEKYPNIFQKIFDQVKVK